MNSIVQSLNAIVADRSLDLTYSIARASHASLTVSNARGEIVVRILDQVLDAGEGSVRINADMLATGIYYCRLSTESGSSFARVALVR